MPWGVAREAASAKMAYEEPKESLIDLLLKLQSGDTSTQQQIQRLFKGLTRDAGSMEDTYAEWRVDPNGLLHYKGAIYMPNDPAVKQEIMKMNHNDPHAGHFGVPKTTELIR